jgi:hypothetical protein
VSIQLSVYVGPYFVVPKGFDWFKFESLVCEGRGEVGSEDEMILVPNCNLPGVSRQMRFSRDDETPVVAITPMAIARECNAFATAAIAVVNYCNRKQIDITTRWGVVPCWS